jgi:hypothetical protein
MSARPLSRRAFLRLALFPLAASAAASLAGCRIAAAEDAEEPPAPAVAGDAEGYVYDNHLHDAVLPKADIEAGGPVDLHIQSHSTHDHVLELTRTEIADIRAGREVRVRSSNDWGHAHEVVFNRKKPGG